MGDALGIEHFFELSGSEKVWAFFTPLIIFAAFFIAQLILPARKVTGYVKNPVTGEPRPYRLNGLLVFVIAQVLWATEVTGLDRDWFYRSTLWAVIGGTVFTAIFAIWAVFSQPKGEIQNPWLALWEGRAKELQFFGERIDIKMWFYVVGGTMLSLNALSGAVWHSENIEGTNPGVYMYAAFMTFYVFDYFVFERVQLYTYDLIHEHLGFKLWWGGLVVYGWLFIIPLYGMAAYPNPDMSYGWRNFWLVVAAALFVIGWSISRGANLQKYMFKRFPDRHFLGLIEPTHIQAGDRKILISGYWGAARHFNYLGEGFLCMGVALSFGHFGVLWAWTYALFIIPFFTIRQRFDDRDCAIKYGPEKWAEYQEKVPYRIFPGVY